MTAAPEPSTYLALVVFPSLHMVVAPRRNWTITLGHVNCGPVHHLARPGHPGTTGVTTVCTKEKTKASTRLSLPTNSNHEMHSDDHGANPQHKGPKALSDPGTSVQRLSPQAQEKKASSTNILDWHGHDLGQPHFTSPRRLRFRRTSLDA